MRKLSLNLDELAVDSFETAQTEQAQGTVEGHARCTMFDTCKCPTSLYACGTLRPTQSCGGL
ncbi:MAG TPA: hypothetical protein VF746_29995 [Longimicrobium sp.]|jgi:hypothetical protein